jgi:hypothetical protein
MVETSMDDDDDDDDGFDWEGLNRNSSWHLRRKNHGNYKKCNQKNHFRD